MLHLTTDDVRAVLTMEECLDALDRTYVALGEGEGAFLPHADIHVATDEPETLDGEVVPPLAYRLKAQTGVVGPMNAGVVRTNSLLMHWPRTDGEPRASKLPSARGGRFTGLILLFDTRTGELLSIMPDSDVGRMRVGATNALAADLMARRGAVEVALVGAGWLAGAHARAIAHLRPVERIRVYSPNSREEFAEELNAREGFDPEVVPAESVGAACKGSDVVFCTTNQLTPVFRREHLESGMHVSCVRQYEVDAATFNDADAVVLLSSTQTGPDHHLVGDELADAPEFTIEDHPQADDVDFDWRSLPDLPAVRVEGFEREPDDATVFANNLGLGVQFAAIARRVYDLAREAGLGEELPQKGFTQPHN